MKKIKFYYHLFTTDRKGFWYQLWMVYNRYKITILKWGFAKINQRKRAFVTIHNRPMDSKSSDTWSDKLVESKKVAIVLQGRLQLDNDFTLETVRLYKKHFVGSIIIVSTDEGSDNNTLAKLAEEGAEIVLSGKPDLFGIGNLNLQLTTSLAGMLKAKALGAEYVYKTRTDQRMYGLNINEFLLNLMKTFPVKSGFKQQQRIIASSFLSLKYVPYLITDMFLFGQIDDMVLYWSAAYDTRTSLSKLPVTIQDVMDARISESYLCSEFLKSIGRNVLWTVEDSWRAYADHFCIVDKETLDLFWYKYDFYQEYPVKSYKGVPADTLLTFAEWLNLYSGLDNKKAIPEYVRKQGRKDYLVTY